MECPPASRLLRTRPAEPSTGQSIDNTMAADNLKNKDANSELEKKIGGKMENLVPTKDTITKFHGKPRNDKAKTANDVKANGSHIMPRIEKPNSEKTVTPWPVKNMADNLKADGGSPAPRNQESNNENSDSARLIGHCGKLRPYSTGAV